MTNIFKNNENLPGLISSPHNLYQYEQQENFNATNNFSLQNEDNTKNEKLIDIASIKDQTVIENSLKLKK